jgi:hypothetical protein
MKTGNDQISYICIYLERCFEVKNYTKSLAMKREE